MTTTIIRDSGVWTPTITTEYTDSTLYSALYSRIGHTVTFNIDFGLLNNTSRLSGDTFFTPPYGLVPSANTILSFTDSSEVVNSNIDTFTVGSNGSQIVFSMINNVSTNAYTINIQGIYLIA